MDNDSLRSTILEVTEAALSAQLKAVRDLRRGKPRAGGPADASDPQGPGKSRSQVNMAYDILAEAGQPLHVSEIIGRIAARFGLRVDRESLVSSLSKRVQRKDRFRRTARNTFALINPASSKADSHE